MTTREKRTRRRRNRVREDVLEITRELVTRHGLGAVTLSTIAKELELTKQALYYYFPSKDALFFELLYETMGREVAAVEAAVAEASNGAEAVEAIIRTVAAHYEGGLDTFRLVYMAGQVGELITISSAELERIRPFNDRFYGRAEALIQQDQDAGLIDENLDARRSAFLAHCAVLGVLTMEGVVDAGDEKPLIHAHAAMIDDLVRIHTAPLRAKN